MTAKKPNRRPWELPRVGDVVAGKYRVESELGRGGLAVVLGAMHLQLRDRVALKMLLPEWGGDPDVVARFLREGRAATRVRGEHVVRVFDVDLLESGQPYLVLEHLSGSDLEALLDASGPLPVLTAVDYILQAAEAIAEAHAVGIVHRDLKPANLFLTTRSDGSPCIKVLDFGISKVPEAYDMDTRPTTPQLVMGSPHYMSPEQLTAAHNADERSDIWALGVILYELLTGRPAFKGASAPELCVRVMRDKPAPLADTRSDVPEALEATILLCLEKEPERRFANVAELALALAPFGPPDARTTADRILKILQGAGRIRRPPVVGQGRGPASGVIVPSQDPQRDLTRRSYDPTERMPPPRRANARTAGVVALCLLAVGALGGAALVHLRTPQPLAPSPSLPAPNPAMAVQGPDAAAPPVPDRLAPSPSAQKIPLPAERPGARSATPTVRREVRRAAPRRAGARAKENSAKALPGLPPPPLPDGG